MTGGTREDFLQCALALRRLLKEPPYLWQPLSPDGENLEHWAGTMGDERVDEREGRREVVERGSNSRQILLRETNGWRGRGSSISLFYLFHQEGLIYDSRDGRRGRTMEKETVKE